MEFGFIVRIKEMGVIKMIKNNFIVIFLHLLVNAVVLLTYGTPSSFPKYGFAGEILIFMLVLLVYFILGYFLTGKVLKYQDTKTKSIISISSIFILGLLVWVYKFFADVWWLFVFFVYNYYAIPLYPIFVNLHYDNPHSLVDLEILFSLLPVLIIWAGMTMKYYNRDKQNKVKLVLKADLK
jgi:hypothetical protein